MSDEKKLGDFSRPDSVVMPAEPPEPRTPVAQDSAPTSAAPEPRSLEQVQPVFAPPHVDAEEVTPPAPVVDSWDGADDDSWQDSAWSPHSNPGPEAPPEPVFQPPPADRAGVEDPRYREPRDRGDGFSPLLVGLALALLALLAAFLWWWLMGRAPEVADDARDARPTLPSPPPERPAAIAATEPRPAVDLPPLDASDPVVRSWLSTLSAHPKLAEWLVPDDLVRRFVVTVDNISRGESPRPHLGVLEPEGVFEVAPRGDGLVVDPATERRYDLLVEVFSSVDIAAGARLYHDLEPLFEEAYLELGDPSRDFRSALTVAIDRLLAVDVPSEPQAVEKGVLSYRYTDPELESLSPAAKHLLRLGPDNAREVQSKLRFFRAALDLPDPPG